MGKILIPAAMQGLYDEYHFAPVVHYNGLYFFSGQLGMNQDGEIPPSPEEEFRTAWQLIGLSLQTAGLDYDNILEISSFHVDMNSHMDVFMAVKDEFIKAPFSAWSALGTTGLALPEARVEIKIIAGADKRAL